MKKITSLLLISVLIPLLIIGCRQSEGDTPRLKKSQVRKIADAFARDEGYDLKEFLEPAIRYDEKTQEWDIFYGQVPMRDRETGKLFYAPGKHFNVYVSDKTGKAIRLMRGS